MAKPDVISSETKIPIKDIAYIIAFTVWLLSIKSDIRELRVKIDGRLNLYEYRLAELEASVPDHKNKIIKLSAALTPRPLTSLTDIPEESDENE